MTDTRLVAYLAAAILAVLIVMVCGLVGALVLTAPDKLGEIIRAMVEGHVVSRAVALFLIVPTIASLCLLDKISGEAAVAALSAIAGYILGGAAVEKVF